MSLNITIISKDCVIFNNNIKYLKVLGLYNEFEIYLNHTPILNILNNSILVLNFYKRNNVYYYIINGILECNLNKITILVNKFISVYNLNKKKILNKKKKILFELKKKNIKKHINIFLLLNYKLKKYNNYLLFLEFNNN